MTLDDPRTQRPRWRPQTFAAFQAPYFARVLISGALWNTTRWMNLFLAAFLAAELTDSPILLQLVGAAIFAPFFFGGAVGGFLSDRFDRRLTVIGYLLFLTPVSLALAGLVLGDAIRVWMLYPFVLVAGFGWVVDLTARRALVADLVGDDLVTNAFSLETLSSSLGGVFGALGGGALVGLVGIGEAYTAIAALHLAAIAVLLTVPSPPRRHRTRRPWRRELRAGIAMLPHHRPLVSILGVTVVVNLFYFPFSALVPEVAEGLGVGAFATGVLSGATTIGATIAAAVVASLARPPRGRIYVLGSLIALVTLPVFALVDVYSVALVALIVSGLGMGGFATMQLTLATTVVEEEARVASWSGRTVTGAFLALAGFVSYNVLGLLNDQIGAAWVEGLRYAVVGSLGAAFLYLGLKAVHLTEMSNRVWKRSSEYGLILAERRRIVDNEVATHDSSRVTE